MGAIVFAFDNLPPEITTVGGYKQRTDYSGVYQDLEALGLPVPAAGPREVTRADLVAHLQAQAGALVKAEIANDPDRLFADAASDRERARLFNDEVAWFDEAAEEALAVAAAANVDVRHTDAPLVQPAAVAPRWRERDRGERQRGTDEVSHPLGRVLRGFPYGPNALTAADIAGARG